MTGTRATIPEPAALSDEEVFDVMVRAFTMGPIDRNDRAPILRMFGEVELIFCLKLDEAAEDGLADGVTLEAQGTAIRLSVAVQRRLKDHFADWLNVH